jgi:integrase
MEIIGSNDDVIFPGDLDDKPITANSVNHHVRRTVESTGKTPYFGLPRWTPHDLRRTCGTNIRRLGGTTKDMDLILGHTAGGVTGIYDRYEGEDEKVKWMLAWSEYISQLIR